MGQPIYLNVGNRKVLTTNVTYDDLIVLYKQYIEKYGEVPTFSSCDSKHNMPQGRIIKRIVENPDITIKCYTFNPFIISRGVKLNRTIIALFENTGWKELSSKYIVTEV